MGAQKKKKTSRDNSKLSMVTPDPDVGGEAGPVSQRKNRNRDKGQSKHPGKGNENHFQKTKASETQKGSEFILRMETIKDISIIRKRICY